MTDDQRPPSSRWLAALAAGALLVTLLVAWAGSPGIELGAFGQFLGRFHPVVVHVPIGALVLLAALELASLFRSHRPHVDVILPVALGFLLLSSVVAFTLGALLGASGEYSLALLSWHKRLALAALVFESLMLGSFAAYVLGQSQRLRYVYRALLVTSLSCLGVAAHFGGSLTHGEGYLVQRAPRWLKGWLGHPSPGKAESSPAPAGSVSRGHEPLMFRDVVQPLLTKYCVACHGPQKLKAGLRLDSYQALLQGGDSGPAINGKEPNKSPLWRALGSAPGADERMPPSGKPQPTEAERELILWWVERGAGDTERVRDLLPPAAVAKLLKTSIASTANRTLEAPSQQPLPEAPRAPGGEPAPAPQPAQGSGAPADTAVVSGDAGLGRRVAELLAARCAGCHGAQKHKGGLSVVSLASLLKGGDSGPALVPGDPDASLVMQRIGLPLGHDEHMPPRQKPQLDAEEIELLSRWIARGARSGLPAETPPDVERPTAERSRGRGAFEDTPSAEAEPDPSPAPAEPGATPAASAVEPVAELSASELGRLPAVIDLYADLVGPLLASECGECHIGDPVMGGLSVASYGDLMQSGTVVPGRPEQSELLARVALPVGDDDKMPPAGEQPLSSLEVAALRFWIVEGARQQAAWEREQLPLDVAHALLERAVPALARASHGQPASAAGQAPSDAVSAARVPKAGCGACAPDSTHSSLAAPFGSLLGSGVLYRRRRTRRQRDR